MGPVEGLVVSGTLSSTTRGKKTCARGLVTFCTASMPWVTTEPSLARAPAGILEGEGGVFGEAREGEGGGWEIGNARRCL
jgi:hypothetical protein